ncbi:MAG: glycosyltransferase family 2 protein [Gallionella sp.]|nr:glycosyltransferase family 2 protein [Gallionella sp.]
MSQADSHRKNLAVPDLGRPLLSIVTVVRNGEPFLEETISSVIAQKTEDVEYIIIDGASSDGTLAIIKKYEEYIDYWISEPDRGIYDAMNKGIRAAKGAFVGLLNSGDRYAAGALTLVLDEIRNMRSRDVVIAGGVAMLDISGRIAATHMVDVNSLSNKFRFMPLNHPAMFVANSIYAEAGLYREDLRICSDYDFVLKLLDRRVEIRFIPEVLTEMRAGGISDSPTTLLTRLREGFQVRRQHKGLGYSLMIVARELMSFLYRLGR